MSRLAGKRVLITGASGGLGRVLAIEFAKRDAKLLLFARRDAELIETADQVRSQGRIALTCVGDVSLSENRLKALETSAKELGGLDVLVNNAGVSAHGRFHDSKADRFQKVMQVNFFAAAEWIRDATPFLSEGNEPAVVNIGSILGWRGAPHNAEYCASKFALRGLSESIRPELKKLGIHLLHVSPGTLDTEFFEHLIEKKSELPWGARKGMPVERAAKQIVKALECRRTEAAIGWEAWWFVRTARFAPWLMDRLMNRYG